MLELALPIGNAISLGMSVRDPDSGPIMGFDRLNQFLMTKAAQNV